MVKLQYMSDIHLEFCGLNFKKKIKISGDILCLAGDICAYGNPEDHHIFLKFLEFVCSKYLYVIHVPGNHEYYSAGIKKLTKTDHSMQAIDKKFKTLQKTFKNYYYLNCRTVILPVKKRKIIFCGATLWTKINKKEQDDVQKGMNDYNYIYYVNSNDKLVHFNVIEMQRLHKKHKNYIKRIIKKFENSGNPIVLITHHKPVADTPKKSSDILTQAYEVDMSNIIKPPVKVAIHGHTHKHYKKKIKGVVYLSNPSGYPNQVTHFDKSLIIKV